MENDINLVDAVLSNDADSFAKAFSAAISAKVSDALEIKKVEIASNLLNAVDTEVTAEPTETGAVDGSETETNSAEAAAESDAV